jgi:hypothetical protein
MNKMKFIIMKIIIILSIFALRQVANGEQETYSLEYSSDKFKY